MDSEDDMHDANDVDSYEEDYYSGDAMYSDDDDDDAAGYDFDNDSDDSDDVIVSRLQKNYTILKEDDICQRQEDDITRICSVLSITRDSACMLLRRYNWNVSNVHEAWFADEDKVRKAVGLLDIRILLLKWRHFVDCMKIVQPEITQEMRGILIDWLVEVCEEYELASETFYLTVALIDLYLSKKCIRKRRLQLLGITCMLLASKYEEILAPRVEELCFITDSTYSKGEVLEMEDQILDVLSFQLSVPTTKKFLRRFLLAAQSSYKSRQKALADLQQMQTVHV